MSLFVPNRLRAGIIPREDPRVPATTWTCVCGHSYKIPPGAVGRRARCRRCGHVARIPAADSPSPKARSAKNAGDAGIPLADERDPLPQVPTFVPPDVVIEESPEEPFVVPYPRSFLADVAHSLLFFIEPENLPSLAIVWLFTAFAILSSGVSSLMLGPGFGFMLAPAFVITVVVIVGWVGSYCMRLIEETVADEDDLPGTTSGGFFESVLRPLGLFAAAWVCLLLPVIAMAVVELTWGLPIPTLWYQMAAVAAVFMWPMAVLCVSIGGITVFARADLMIASVLRTFVPYLLVWLLLAITGLLTWYVCRLLATPPPGRPSPLANHPLPATVLIGWVFAYATIIAMRIIGLYYRHYKQRFAWSWE